MDGLPLPKSDKARNARFRLQGRDKEKRALRLRLADKPDPEPRLLMDWFGKDYVLDDDAHVV